MASKPENQYNLTTRIPTTVPTTARTTTHLIKNSKHPRVTHFYLFVVALNALRQFLYILPFSPVSENNQKINDNYDHDDDDDDDDDHNNVKYITRKRANYHSAYIY